MFEYLLLFLTTRIKKMTVWKTRFVSEHLNRPVPNDQVFCTRCMLWLLVLAIPANSAARANHAKSTKHIVDYLSHVFFQTYICINTNAKMC